MSEQQYTRQTPVPERGYEGVAPPPRLLWLALGMFLFIVIVALIGVIVYQSEQRITALLPLAVFTVGALFVIALTAMVIYRKKLPRRFGLYAVIGVFILITLGAVSGVVVFRTLLPPRYQEGIVTVVPFMRALLPPTPVGGALPTAAPDQTGDISPEDLLSAPLFMSTATQTTEATAAVIQVEASATPTHTATPTATATPTTEATTAAQAVPPTGEFSASVSVPARPGAARLFGFTHIKQGWNECGPANITMALSYYGWRDGLSVAEAFLKPNAEDKNVNPGEMVAFVNERTQVRAITRIGGDLNLLKDFLAADLPVIIETGYMFAGYDWIGHYQTLVGYDDVSKIFYLYDSYLGAGENGEGIAESYDALDEQWKHFNRTFIVIYPPDRETEVARLLGVRADLDGAAENALQVAQEEARINPQDPFAWFNIGTAYTRLGRYEEAAAAYDRSRRVGTIPWRIIWYQHSPFEAYYETGRYDDVLALVQSNLNNTPYVEETYYWRGKVLAAQGDSSGAASAFNQALALNPRYTAAQQALDQLNA
jgi:tetratricopeptide (TPR) repeat protein